MTGAGEIPESRQESVEPQVQTSQIQEIIPSAEAKRQLEDLFSRKKDELHSIVHRDFFLNRDAHQGRDELLTTVDRVLDTQLQDWNRDIAVAESAAGEILKTKFDELHGQASALLASLHNNLQSQLEEKKNSGDWTSLAEILPTAHFSKEEVKGVERSIDMHAFIVNTGIPQVDFLKSEYYKQGNTDPREATIMAIEECVKRGWLKDKEALEVAQRFKLEQDQRLQAGHLYDIEDEDHQELPAEIRPRKASLAEMSEPSLEAKQEPEMLDLTAGTEYIVQKGDTPQLVLAKAGLNPGDDKYDHYMIWMELQKNGKAHLLEGQKLTMPDDTALQKAREYMKPDEIKKRCLEAVAGGTKIKLGTDYDKRKVRLDQLFNEEALYVNSSRYNDKPGQYTSVERHQDGHYYFVGNTKRFYIYGGETVRTEPPKEEPVIVRQQGEEPKAILSPTADVLKQSFFTPEDERLAISQYLAKAVPTVFSKLGPIQSQNYTFKGALVEQLPGNPQYKIIIALSHKTDPNKTIETTIDDPSELTEAKLTEIVTFYFEKEQAQVAQVRETLPGRAGEKLEPKESPADKLKKIADKLPKESEALASQVSARTNLLNSIKISLKKQKELPANLISAAVDADYHASLVVKETKEGENTKYVASFPNEDKRLAYIDALIKAPRLRPVLKL